MSVTDPIADMLTRVRNANRAKHDSVDIPSSRLKLEITRILYEEGYIRGYEVRENEAKPVIRIFLKYDRDRKGAITDLKRISKPGLRVYAKKDEIPRVLGGMGIVILSTSRGVLTGKKAKEIGVGGEVICYVW
ncbi:MAG: 30S ribosomal protein S8 [Actinobacteria bacterium]|nr:30S ribosomal protein S8 [Actinomycetota bacterium]